MSALQNFTMITKYNLFIVNKWILTTLKNIFIPIQVLKSFAFLAKNAVLSS